MTKRAANIPSDEDETVSTSLRLTKEGEILRAMIAKKQGVNKTGAVELALRHYAEFLGLTIDGAPREK